MTPATTREKVESLLRDARGLHHREQFEAGRQKLDQAVKEAEGHPQLLSEVVSGYWESGRLADAAELLEAVLEELERKPNFVTSDEQALFMTRLGAARVRLGKLDDALEVLKDAVALSDNGYSALQLGNALRYRGAFEEAGEPLKRAFKLAEAERDGGLAIAALCGQGELALDQNEAQQAARLFGQALGLTEFSRDEALTVAPLAGLSHAHTHWGNPKKAGELGRKALARAERADDVVGKARVLLALGVADRDTGQLELAEKEATAAPHQPLAVRALVARLELAFDEDLYQQACTLAQKIGMHRDLAALECLK